jgi:hypothetical protein
MRIIITIDELKALDMSDLVEALEYVEADIERAEDIGLDRPAEYTFDVCTVEVDDA